MANIATNNRIPATGNGAVPVVNTSVTIGNTSTLVLAEGMGRLHALITNDSDETIYLGIGAAAVMNKGIRLNANGGVFDTSQSALYTHAIYAICTSGGKNICLQYAGQ
jgi:hypothetical protein